MMYKDQIERYMDAHRDEMIEERRRPWPKDWTR